MRDGAPLALEALCAQGGPRSHDPTFQILELYACAPRSAATECCELKGVYGPELWESVTV